jgi:hypothetical protein
MIMWESMRYYDADNLWYTMINCVIIYDYTMIIPSSTGGLEW